MAQTYLAEHSSTSNARALTIKKQKQKCNSVMNGGEIIKNKS